MQNRICAGIVTYNPDIERLNQNINSIVSQVNKVIIFDNASNNQKEISHRFDNNVTVIESETNIGISGALNRLFKWGIENEFEWMVTLDQDSLCEKDYILRMSSFLNISSRIGLIAPVIVDCNMGLVGHTPRKDWKEVRTCITSGSINNIHAWNEIGGFDESMFIDSVDFEYCYRMRKGGYKIIQIGNVFLSHEIGKGALRRFLFFRIKVYGHSAFRKYYIARNNVYYPLKHHLWIRFIRGNVRNVLLVLIVCIYEDDKKNKIKAIINGWKDGVKALNHEN